MKRSRYTQRYSGTRPASSNLGALHRTNSRRPTRAPRQIPDQDRTRRVAPAQISPSQVIQDNQKEIDSEKDFNHACKGFFEGICHLQMIAILFFFILMLFTQILQDMFNIALICYRVLVAAYILAIVKRILSNPIKNKEKPKMIYRLIEMIVFIFFISSGNDSLTLTILFSVLLGSYLLRMIYSFTINRSEYTNFGNNMNNIVLLLRALILAQGILVTVQLNLESPMTWFLVIVPVWIMTVIIFVLTAILFKSVYFTYKSQFWKSELSEKKRAAKWIFGNLFALLLLLPCISHLVAFVLEGYISNSDRPLLAPFIVLILWCTNSLIYARKIHLDVIQITKDFKDILDAGVKISPEPRIKYVIKISSTYYKSATEQVIKQLKSQSKSSVSPSGDAEIEAGLTGTPAENNNCIICCKSAPNGVFMECGHGGLCFECGKEIIKSKKECHMCRETIKSLLKVDIKNSKAIYCKVIGGIIKENELDRQ